MLTIIAPFAVYIYVYKQQCRGFYYRSKSFIHGRSVFWDNI